MSDTGESLDVGVPMLRWRGEHNVLIIKHSFCEIGMTLRRVITLRWEGFGDSSIHRSTKTDRVALVKLPIVVFDNHLLLS